MFEHPNKEDIYANGIHTGLPDMGAQSNVGFYYDLQDALFGNLVQLVERLTVNQEVVGSSPTVSVK